ncbi:hypothetical protein Tco_1178607, partial [Tanacetum coccineum]
MAGRMGSSAGSRLSSATAVKPNILHSYASPHDSQQTRMSGVRASTVHKWTTLSGSGVDDVRVMT